MADRYEDFDRNRDRERERDRDAGQRFDDSRRQWRGEGAGQGNREYRGERDYGREERDWGSGEWRGSESRYGQGTQTSEFDRRPGDDWRGRDRSGYAGRGLGGGMSTYSGQDWTTQRQGSYGGGMSEGSERGGYGERSFGERGGYQGSNYGQTGYGQESYGGGRFGSESHRGSSYGGASTYGGQETAGRFTGRGPKGYQRSDERIREDVCERLTHHADVDASEIDIQVNNGDVTLTGSVDDRHQKRMAEDIAENISGVREVHNQLRVSKGLGQRMGEALGLSGGREEDRTAGTTTTTGRQNQPTTTRR